MWLWSKLGKYSYISVATTGDSDIEDRGPICTLLVYIDDAISRLMHPRFVETESTFADFAATQGCLEVHGKPVAFYSDLRWRPLIMMGKYS